MTELQISGVILLCVFGGAIAGMFVRSRLPEHHLAPESKDVVKVGTGLIGTMAALVLGLLVGSAKGSYDAQKGEVTELAATVLLLDRVLAHYGPEAQDARAHVRQAASVAMGRIWGTTVDGSTLPLGVKEESLTDALHNLIPKDDAQRARLAEAQALGSSFAHTRLLLFEQASGSAVAYPLLMVLVVWLTAIFFSFGMFAPANATVIVTLLLCAASVSSALFLILELDHPFDGVIQISDAPLRRAIEHLGK